MLCLLLTSCGTKKNYIPDYGKDLAKKPELGVVITNPLKQVQESKTKALTVFPVLFPGQLFFEAVGKTDKEGFVDYFNGVWPVLAVDMRDPELKIKLNISYFKKETFWKTTLKYPLLEVVSKEGLAETKNYLFLLADRACNTWLFSPTRPNSFYSTKDGYDPHRFETDKAYRAAVFAKYGMTLEQILSDHRELETIQITTFGEVRPGTENWKIFNGDLRYSMNNEMVLDNGAPVFSSHKKEAVKDLTRKNPGGTSLQRFWKNLYLPLTDPTALLYSTGSQVLTHGFREAFTNPEIEGDLAQAKASRQEMAERILWLNKINDYKIQKYGGVQ
jgi:hypothetical protein